MAKNIQKDWTNSISEKKAEVGKDENFIAEANESEADTSENSNTEVKADTDIKTKTNDKTIPDTKDKADTNKKTKTDSNVNENSAEENKSPKNIIKNFTKPSSSARKSPQTGKKLEIKCDFEKEYKKLKIKLDSSLQEKSELVSNLEQVRLESRNLRAKLVGLGVDISSLQTYEGEEISPEDNETRENIRLLECQLEAFSSELRFNTARKQLFLHFKGGTGKTCLSVSYGHKLATLGFKVLMIDLDPLGHLTELFRIENLETKESVYDVLINGVDITKAISKTDTRNLFVLPSNISLSAIEVPLSSMPMPGERLRMALNKIENDFDFIIMDAGPNIGYLSLNAILASDDLLIPVLADYLSYHGLKVLFEILASIENDFSCSFDNICIILNKFNEFHDVCFNAKRALESHYSDFLLKTVIHDSSDIANATSSGKSVFEVSNNSRGVEDILKFIFEILFYIGGKKW